VNRQDWPGGFHPPAKGQKLDYRIVIDHFKKFAVPGTDQSASSDDVLDFRANLLYALPANHRYSHIVLRRLNEHLALAPEVFQKYERNRQHQHFDTHRRKYGADPNTTGSLSTSDCHCRKAISSIFTVDGSMQIDSFGKNVNYLWPSNLSVKELAANYFPRQDLSLKEDLSLAELMFGFSGRHRKNKEGESISHPYCKRRSNNRPRSAA